ncbi:MAG: CRTAC1 family protein [Planctomycetales bacterium]
MSELPRAAFRDVAEEAGLRFHHDNGMTGERLMVEMVGPGSALLDYDRDGDLDLFLVQGCRLGADSPPDPVRGPWHRLFRNDLTKDSTGKPIVRFTDVSDEAGLKYCDYGMGVVAGDYDRDGWTDLYLTCFGANRLLRNTGHGGFEDQTAAAIVAGDGGWSSSGAWVDVDRDGWLDLFVCRYLEWDYTKHKRCSSPGGKADYCGPRSFEPARSRLYRNLGNGTFEDVSRASRVSSQAGAALGVVCADVTQDGWPDLFVANDGMVNHLWINQRDGTFREEATPRGCAINSEGMTEANMGVIAADFHNRGRMDLFITHLKNEHATFYENQGEGLFADMTMSLGLDAPTRPFTGFGTGALDYDNDGWLDIFAANGEVRINDAQWQAGVKLPMRQRSLLFHSRGGLPLRFEEIREGAFLKVEEVGRGAALGDIDNDGDTDIVVSNAAGPVRLLLNDVGQDQHWLGLRLLEGSPEARIEAYGAVCQVDCGDGRSQWRRCAADGSYLSSSDPRVLFGLGTNPEVPRVVVTWPDGVQEEWQNLAVDRYHELVRGTGRPVSSDGAQAAVSEPVDE